MKQAIRYLVAISTVIVVIFVATGGPGSTRIGQLRREKPVLAINLNIQAVLELESMEDIVWGHIPDADRGRIVEKWFWDSMGCYQCIEQKQMPVASCMGKYQASMMMLMGGVINNKYLKECQASFANSTLADAYMGDDKCDGCPVCPCHTSGTTQETSNITLSAIERLGAACWNMMSDDPRSKKLIVYELLNMKSATNCVNEPGGSVCTCSQDFNNGIRQSLSGVVSNDTQAMIFEHLVQYC